MEQWNDPIIADVRSNREALLYDFNGDIHELIKYLKEQHPKKEAAGWEAITIKELEANRSSLNAQTASR